MSLLTTMLTPNTSSGGGGGGGADTWSQYPATQAVNFDGNVIDSVGNITGTASQALTIFTQSNQDIVFSPNGMGQISLLSKGITQTFSAAGQSVGMATFNNSNTAGSDAVVLIGTGGSSAGDPTTLYTAGTTNYVSGLDNSTGQYKIASGSDLGAGADLLVVDSTGAGQVNALVSLLSAQDSNAGGNVTVAALNSSTAANSNAIFGLSVNGTGAGDPFIQYAIAGIQTCSTGVANSDSDKYKISMSASLGTNDVFTANPATGDLEFYSLLPAAANSSGGNVSYFLASGNGSGAGGGLTTILGSGDVSGAGGGSYFATGSGGSAIGQGGDYQVDTGGALGGNARGGDFLFNAGTGNGSGRNGRANFNCHVLSTNQEITVVRIENPSPITYSIILSMPFNATINSFSASTTAGACTIVGAINGTPITMTPINVTTAVTTSAATAANNAVAGNLIVVLVSALAGAQGLTVQVTYTRTS